MFNMASLFNFNLPVCVLYKDYLLSEKTHVIIIFINIIKINIIIAITLYTFISYALSSSTGLDINVFHQCHIHPVLMFS